MEHVLAFIQELNELACAAFIEKLFPVAAALVFQYNPESGVQEGNFL